MWYFSTITAQLTIQQCFQHILNIYIRYYLQLHYPVYWLCCLYMLPLHNVIFFHNDCTNNSTTMSTAYSQHIHIDLFKTTLHSILALLFIYAFLFTMWYFPQWLHNWHYTNVCSISSTYTYNTVWNTLPSIMTLLFTYASFSQYDIFSQLLPNWLSNNVYSIFATYTYSTVCNYSPQ